MAGESKETSGLTYMKGIFFEYPSNINQRIIDLKTKPAIYWQREGEKYINKLIEFVIKNVPAYQKFLKENGINYEKIKGFKDLNNLPIIDKNNYLRKFNYLELFPNKDISIATTVSTTSGSTGEPFYFPRGYQHDLMHLYTTEIFLRNQWEIDKYNTLVILGFGLGIWIGGLLNFEGLMNLVKKGYKITTVPVGVNKELFLKSFEKFAPYYEQIILIGYPPFIKDLADEGEIRKINWKKHRIRILNAAEGFSEKFREYIEKKFGLKNLINDNINIYGTVELGTMAHETAFSNLIRKIAVEKDKIFKAIFPEVNRIPTLAQYHPYIVYFEEKEGLIIASGYGNSMPLIRYSFPDRGGVITFDDMIKKLKSTGVDIFEEAKKFEIEKKILKLPFVYVYERSDFTVSFVGIIIYPEYIRNTLIKRNLQKYLTGKFSMFVDYDKNMSQKLKIHIELKKDIKPNNKIKNEVRQEILGSLIKHSTEYNHLYSIASPQYKKQLEPEIYLHLYDDPQYFKPGIKQKWTIKK